MCRVSSIWARGYQKKMIIVITIKVIDGVIDNVIDTVLAETESYQR